MFYTRDKNLLESYLKKPLLLNDYILYLSTSKNKTKSSLLKYKDLLINNFKFLEKKNNIFRSPTKVITNINDSCLNNSIVFIKKNKNLIFYDIDKIKNSKVNLFFHIFFKKIIINYNNLYLNYIKQKESRKLS